MEKNISEKPFTEENTREEKGEKKDIRLIGLDLDGTTLTSDKVLTARTKAVLEACLERGIEVLPATGRAKAGIPAYLTGIKGIRYILLSNGALVYDMKEDRYVYQNLLSFEKSMALLDQLEAYGSFYDLFAGGFGRCEGRFLDNLDDYAIEPHIQDLIHMSRKRIDNLRDWLLAWKKPVEKFTVFFADPEARLQAMADMGRDPDLAVTSSIPNNMELNSASCNKGDALLSLGRMLGISPSQIMACGDGVNDLDMVRMAGFGVAMDNGMDQVKEAADFITKSCDEEGVAYAIERFVL